MQKELDLARKDEDGVRLFDGRRFLAHYRHVKAGVATRDGCAFCEGGVGSVVKDIERPVPKPVVVQGDGTDEEGDTTSPRPNGWPYERE